MLYFVCSSSSQDLSMLNKEQEDLSADLGEENLFSRALDEFTEGKKYIKQIFKLQTSNQESENQINDINLKTTHTWFECGFDTQNKEFQKRSQGGWQEEQPFFDLMAKNNMEAKDIFDGFSQKELILERYPELLKKNEQNEINVINLYHQCIDTWEFFKIIAPNLVQYYEEHCTKNEDWKYIANKIEAAKTKKEKDFYKYLFCQWFNVAHSGDCEILRTIIPSFFRDALKEGQAEIPDELPQELMKIMRQNRDRNHLFPKLLFYRIELPISASQTVDRIVNMVLQELSFFCNFMFNNMIFEPTVDPSICFPSFFFVINEYCKTLLMAHEVFTDEEIVEKTKLDILNHILNQICHNNITGAFATHNIMSKETPRENTKEVLQNLQGINHWDLWAKDWKKLYGCVQQNINIVIKQTEGFCCFPTIPSDVLTLLQMPCMKEYFIRLHLLSNCMESGKIKLPEEDGYFQNFITNEQQWMLDHMDGAELDTDQKKRGLEEFVELDCAISKNKELLNINNYNENFFIDQQQQIQNQNEIKQDNNELSSSNVSAKNIYQQQDTSQIADEENIYQQQYTSEVLNNNNNNFMPKFDSQQDEVSSQNLIMSPLLMPIKEQNQYLLAPSVTSYKPIYIPPCIPTNKPIYISTTNKPIYTPITNRPIYIPPALNNVSDSISKSNLHPTVFPLLTPTKEQNQDLSASTPFQFDQSTKTSDLSTQEDISLIESEDQDAIVKNNQPTQTIDLSTKEDVSAVELKDRGVATKAQLSSTQTTVIISGVTTSVTTSVTTIVGFAPYHPLAARIFAIMAA